MSLPYDPELICRARELRKSQTSQERHLWHNFLRAYPIRFQRQKVIDCFIVDFYCHTAKLVVELDGAQHYTKQGLADDTQRTAALETYGLQVLRFTNEDVDKRFSAVCERIDEAVCASTRVE